MEEMSGESVVSSAVPAATTRTTSFKGSSPSSKYVKLNVGGALYYTTMQTLTKLDSQWTMCVPYFQHPAPRSFFFPHSYSHQSPTAEERRVETLCVVVKLFHVDHLVLCSALRKNV
uniref:BTB/POZ domain-containing protein KCTD10 n=1 Tax=Salmo salar TaxID=8030 RepID=B5XBB3_SALSA|nr:BTB/POZ domain-containing protein KCTD10 [Salmo salar]